MIRVLIADEIARIVGDLEKLEPHADAVEVCGVAHQASAVIEEARLRQPDLLLLRDRFVDVQGATSSCRPSVPRRSWATWRSRAPRIRWPGQLGARCGRRAAGRLCWSCSPGRAEPGHRWSPPTSQ